ncbi:MAG TPA: ABC transporter permease [Thermoanaerobaculia bacterium]
MILDVVRTGWMNLRRDRAAMMLSFLVPIVFFSIFYGVFGAQRSGMPKVHLAIADEDRSENSKRLVAALRNESALTIVDSAKNSKTQFTAASAEDYVRAGDISIALVIPKGFGAAPIRFGGGTESGPALRLLSDSADPVAPQVVSGLLQKTVMTALPDLMAQTGADAVDRWSGGLTPQQRATINKNIAAFRDYTSRPRTQSTQSMINIQTRDVVGKNRRNTVVSLYAAGIAVMFLLFTASGAGGALLEEIESGTLDRILTTRLTLTTLLLGKLAYLWTLGVSQILVMFIWGAVLFHLELLQHLPGFIIMTAATALATSAFGLLLASMSRSRAQLSALANLIVLSISALGGSMWPRFLMPPAMQKAGLALFNSWAIEGFTNVFWREEPLGSLVLPVVVLLAWAAAFFLTARRLTARWDVS